MNVPFYRHDIPVSAAEDVAKVISTPFLTSGPVGRAVEQQLADYFGVGHGLLVNSWTNGAVAMLLALNIKPGDEVIVPAMTFAATANIAELIGAKAVFVDVDPQTLLMTPETLAAAITPRTRAVIPVHLYGQMVDIAALRAVLAGRPDIAIIEDCAHCFEGKIGDERPGAHSDAAIFSFYATKNVACGEGGAIVTKSDALAEALKVTRLHGMSASAMDRFKTGQYRHWDIERLGMKANLPDLLACLLPKQIETIDARLPAREAIAQRYDAAFGNLPIKTQKLLPNRTHARHLYTIHVDPAVRDAAITALGEAGIGVTVNYRSVPLLTYYREKYGFKPGQFPHAENWGDGTITLPFFPSMTEAEIDRVIEVVRDTVVPMIEAQRRAA